MIKKDISQRLLDGNTILLIFGWNCSEASFQK
jgi:hypothetical protein